MLSDFPEITPIVMDFYRPTTSTDNSFHAPVQTYPTEPTETVDMAMRHLTGSKRFTSQIHGYSADYRGYCDGAPDIQPGDRGVDPEGNRYEVKAVNDPMGLAEFLQVDMLQVTNDGNNQQLGEGS